MKIYLLTICLITFSQVTIAKDVLNNCFSKFNSEYFVSELENIAQNKSTPILLLNKTNEVVGVISVNAKRSSKYPHNAKTVKVNKLRLCSTMAVNSFYYADNDASNLLKWSNSHFVNITQDEGMIDLSTVLIRKDDHASFYKVTFTAYDVFTKDGEEETDDWGSPKASGEFFFYIPINWTIN